MAVTKRKYKSGKIVWSYAFDAPGSGRTSRSQVTESGFGTKADAVAAEAARRIAVQQTAQALPQNPTTSLPKNLSELLDEFFVQHGEKRLGRKTLERYRDMVGYLSPVLLAMPISEIGPLHLSREWNRLLECGGKVRKTGAARCLSQTTVRKIAGVVSSAFSRGVEWQLTASNPVPASKPPVARRKPAVILSPAEQTLLIASATSPFGLAAFLTVAAETGARRGELLALKWSDIQGNLLTVSRSLSQTKEGLTEKGTKSGRSKQIHLLPSSVACLAKHRKAQQVFRTQYGADYRNDLDLVFCQTDGLFLRPDSISAAVSALCRRLKFRKGANLHSLRHTHASEMLASGVELPVVSARLGHSTLM